MPVERAVKAYQLERLNCAQSVLRAFQAPGQPCGETVRAASTAGHGLAAGGLCGALYVARQLAGTEVARERISSEFAAATGSTRCREIRRAGRVPCVECVRLATRLLVEYGQPVNEGVLAEPVRLAEVP